MTAQDVRSGKEKNMTETNKPKERKKYCPRAQSTEHISIRTAVHAGTLCRECATNNPDDLAGYVRCKKNCLEKKHHCNRS